MDFLVDQPLRTMGVLLILGALISFVIRWAVRRGRTKLGAWCVFANIIVGGLAVSFAVTAIGEALR